MARILGLAVKRPRPGGEPYSELGFVAVTRGRGQGRGWTVGEGLRTLTDVLRLGGTPAVDQLRRFAQLALRRMWTMGLLTPADVAEVMAIQTAAGDVRTTPAPVSVVPFAMDYRPGSRIVSQPERQRIAKLVPVREVPFR